MYDCIFLISEVTGFQNFWIGLRWSWTYSFLSFFFQVYNYMGQAIYCESQDAHLFSSYLKYLLLFMFKVSSSNVQYLLPQVSGILQLGFSFQHRSWAAFFLGAVTFHLSRALSLVLLTFAYIVAYLDSILTDSDRVRSFFGYLVSAIIYKFLLLSVGNCGCESPWQIVLR